jgi:hypothetical protein
MSLLRRGDPRGSQGQRHAQFTRQQTKNGISFAEWNGDYMAGLLVDGVLREQLVDKSLRASFQKAVAMVDEPQVAFEHFERLLRGLCKVKGTNPRQRATILRQITSVSGSSLSGHVMPEMWRAPIVRVSWLFCSRGI